MWCFFICKDIKEDKIKQRRVYGRDGNVIVDYDTSDHNRQKYHPNGAHKHTYKVNDEGILSHSKQTKLRFKEKQ